MNFLSFIMWWLVKTEDFPFRKMHLDLACIWRKKWYSYAQKIPKRLANNRLFSVGWEVIIYKAKVYSLQAFHQVYTYLWLLCIKMIVLEIGLKITSLKYLFSDCSSMRRTSAKLRLILPLFPRWTWYSIAAYRQAHR